MRLSRSNFQKVLLHWCGMLQKYIILGGSDMNLSLIFLKSLSNIGMRNIIKHLVCGMLLVLRGITLHLLFMVMLSDL